MCPRGYSDPFRDQQERKGSAKPRRAATPSLRVRQQSRCPIRGDGIFLRIRGDIRIPFAASRSERVRRSRGAQRRHPLGSANNPVAPSGVTGFFCVSAGIFESLSRPKGAKASAQPRRGTILCFVEKKLDKLYEFGVQYSLWTGYNVRGINEKADSRNGGTAYELPDAYKHLQ